jgi:hypothetical protein
MCKQRIVVVVPTYGRTPWKDPGSEDLTTVKTRENKQKQIRKKQQGPGPGPLSSFSLQGRITDSPAGCWRWLYAGENIAVGGRHVRTYWSCSGVVQAKLFQSSGTFPSEKGDLVGSIHIHSECRRSTYVRAIALLVLVSFWPDDDLCHQSCVC